MREVNPGVKVNLWLVNPRVNLSMEQSALRQLRLIGWLLMVGLGPLCS